MYILSNEFEEMTVSAKDVTTAKVCNRKCILNKGIGDSVRTNYQTSAKSIFRQLFKNWKSLTNAQILTWNAFALSN